MSEMLKVTQPIVRTEQATNLRPVAPNIQDSTITGIVDPSKVVRPDGQHIQEDASGQQKANLTSNFDAFLQMVRTTQGLSDSVPELLLSKLATIVNSGIDTGFAQEIANLMELLKMTGDDLLPFLESQLQTSVKFQGPIFDELRKILSSTKNEDLKNSILEFLKTFDNASSANHTMKNILANLKHISDRMPSESRRQLLEIMQELSREQTQGAGAKNLNILKGKIIPFLSNYIGSTRDFGPIRDIITRLTLNIVSYENGTTEKLLNALQALLKNPLVSKQLSGISAKEIEGVLANTRFKNADTTLTDSLVNIIARGIKGDTKDPSNKEFFLDILKSVLINKSVYMPLQHVIIPANINGKMFFSEMWIDPDANNAAKLGSDSEPAAKLLIKFDIQDIGFFEMVIVCQGKKIDMLFFHPQSFASKSYDIKKTITNIILKNGLTCSSLAVEKSNRPLPVSDVFPKIYERRDSINVKV